MISARACQYLKSVSAVSAQALVAKLAVKTLDAGIRIASPVRSGCVRCPWHAPHPEKPSREISVRRRFVSSGDNSGGGLLLRQFATFRQIAVLSTIDDCCGITPLLTRLKKPIYKLSVAAAAIGLAMTAASCQPLQQPAAKIQDIANPAASVA